MCQSDIRFGRLIRSVTKVGTLASGGTLSVAANPQRIGFVVATASLLLTGPTIVTLTVDGNLITMLGSGGPLQAFDIRQHGDFVTKSILLTNGTSANTPVSITEFLVPESAITSHLEKWNKDM